MNVQKRSEHGAFFDELVDLESGQFADLRFLGRAARLDKVETYDSSLLLAASRVRGVGYNSVGRNNFGAKRKIPAGWHQNRVDPSLHTLHPGHNLHEPLVDFNPTDFADFISKCAELWSLNVTEDGRLL